MASKAPRESKASTAQFIALLRALGMVVDSYNVSHAQLERMLCERIAAGRVAEERLRGLPRGSDQSVDTKDRDKALLNGTDGLIIASYSITDGRIKEGISFTIPYLLSFQGILIRSADAGAIKSVTDLRRKKVCTGPKTSTPYQHLVAVNQEGHLGITILPATGDWICAEELVNKKVDAQVGDDAILFGYQTLHPGLAMVGTKVWPRPEQYGIGFIAKSPADAAELNAAVRAMIRDGSWAKAIVANFCPDSPTAAACPEARLFLDSPPPAP